jgi:hypothetical protein
MTDATREAKREAGLLLLSPEDVEVEGLDIKEDLFLDDDEEYDLDELLDDEEEDDDDDGDDDYEEEEEGC